MQMMQQTHQMDQYPMPMPPQQMQEQQYMWQQQQDANQRNFGPPPPNNMNMPMYNSPMMDPQMHYVSESIFFFISTIFFFSNDALLFEPSIFLEKMMDIFGKFRILNFMKFCKIP